MLTIEQAVEAVSPEDLKFILDHPEFESRPVDARTFITSPEYLNCEDAWPEIQNIIGEVFKGSDKTGRLSIYKEFVFDAGIGSGKSFIVSCIFAYATYWLQCLESPQQYFGLAKGSTIALLNMSKSAMQAKKVVFGDIKARIDGSPWFQKNCKPDPNVHSEMRFPKNIVLFPGNSSETFPLGYNVFLANMDEASFYTETEYHDVAQEIYDALDRRVTSRFGDKGLIAITSSPRYVDDFTEKKYEEAKQNDKIYAVRRATWDMRPGDRAAIERGECFEEIPPGGTAPVKIPMVYKKAFSRNPKKAWRDFGAVASLVLEAYFTDEEISLLEQVLSSSKLPSNFDEIKPIPGVPYFIHVDLGIKRDACGLAMAHAEGTSNPKVVADLLLRIVSRQRAEELMSKGEHVDMTIGQDQVDIEQVENLIYQLSARGFWIRKVTFDQYQSVSSRQQMEKHGFETDLLSVDKNTECYDTLKSVIRTRRFDAPNHPHFPKECRRLELVEGKKVDHPPNCSKDVADAAAGATKSCLEQFDEEVEVEETILDESVRIEVSQQI